MRVRELKSGRELLNFNFYTENDVAFSPDLRLAASVDHDQNAIYLWDLATGKISKRLERGGRGMVFLTFAPDGRSLLEAALSGGVYLWEVATGQQRRAILLPYGDRCAAFAPDGRYIALGERDLPLFVKRKLPATRPIIRLYDLALDRVAATLDGHEGSINVLRFSANGRVVHKPQKR